MTVSPPVSYTCRSSFDIDGLADAFAEVEKHDVRVASVLMHPDSIESFYGKDAGEVFDIDKDGNHRIWGADVSFDTEFPLEQAIVAGDSKPIRCRLEKATDEELAERQQKLASPDDLVGSALRSTTSILLDVMEKRNEVASLIEELRERGHLDGLSPTVTADSE